MTRIATLIRADRIGARGWLAVATALAAIATAGSLYFSEVLGLFPCELCWFQRIFMYPLVIVLGLAVIDDRPGIYRTGLALSIPGGVIAGYHSVLQRTADPLAGCPIGGGCVAIQYQVFGLTIPNLALVAFGLITLALLAVARSS